MKKLTNLELFLSLLTFSIIFALNNPIAHMQATAVVAFIFFIFFVVFFLLDIYSSGVLESIYSWFLMLIRALVTILVWTGTIFLLMNYHDYTLILKALTFLLSIYFAVKWLTREQKTSLYGE